MLVIALIPIQVLWYVDIS